MLKIEKERRRCSRLLNRGGSKEDPRGSRYSGRAEGCWPDKSGLSGHLLSFVLPAIFCHPFALLFSVVKTAPVHSRRDVVSGNLAIERKKETCKREEREREKQKERKSE